MRPRTWPHNQCSHMAARKRAGLSMQHLHSASIHLGAGQQQSGLQPSAGCSPALGTRQGKSGTGPGDVRAASHSSCAVRLWQRLHLSGRHTCGLLPVCAYRQCNLRCVAVVLLHTEQLPCRESRQRPVVQSSEVAKSLAFHQEVRTRCITLQGDDFNPSGTLTGVLLASTSVHVWQALP